jgi:hypothetical protein
LTIEETKPSDAEQVRGEFTKFPYFFLCLRSRVGVFKVVIWNLANLQSVLLVFSGFYRFEIRR